MATDTLPKEAAENHINAIWTYWNARPEVFFDDAMLPSKYAEDWPLDLLGVLHDLARITDKPDRRDTAVSFVVSGVNMRRAEGGGSPAMLYAGDVQLASYRFRKELREKQSTADGGANSQDGISAKDEENTSDEESTGSQEMSGHEESSVTIASQDKKEDIKDDGELDDDEHDEDYCMTEGEEDDSSDDESAISETMSSFHECVDDIEEGRQKRDLYLDLQEAQLEAQQSKHELKVLRIKRQLKDLRNGQD